MWATTRERACAFLYKNSRKNKKKKEVIKTHTHTHTHTHTLKRQERRKNYLIIVRVCVFFFNSPALGGIAVSNDPEAADGRAAQSVDAKHPVHHDEEGVGLVSLRQLEEQAHVRGRL